MKRPKSAPVYSTELFENVFLQGARKLENKETVFDISISKLKISFLDPGQEVKATNEETERCS